MLQVSKLLVSTYTYSHPDILDSTGTVENRFILTDFKSFVLVLMQNSVLPLMKNKVFVPILKLILTTEHASLLLILMAFYSQIAIDAYLSFLFKLKHIAYDTTNNAIQSKTANFCLLFFSLRFDSQSPSKPT